MTTASNCASEGASLSFSLKCESNSPTSRPSSFARAILDGATQRFSSVAGLMISANVNAGSMTASYTERSTVATSKYDIVLFAWGSRSIRRVFLRRSGREIDGRRGLSDATLLVGDGDNHEPDGLVMSLGHSRGPLGACQSKPLHLVAHILRIETFQPSLQSFLVGLVARDV